MTYIRSSLRYRAHILQPLSRSGSGSVVSKPPHIGILLSTNKAVLCSKKEHTYCCLACCALMTFFTIFDSSTRKARITLVSVKFLLITYRVRTHCAQRLPP